LHSNFDILTASGVFTDTLSILTLIECVYPFGVPLWRHPAASAAASATTTAEALLYSYGLKGKDLMKTPLSMNAVGLCVTDNGSAGPAMRD